jgi:hypothetical protein
MSEVRLRRRTSDRGFWCLVAQRATDTWDFIDARDIDKHAMAWATFLMTCYIMQWVLTFVWLYPDKAGLETGLIIAAIMVPWTPLQAAVIKWYFNARTDA